VQSEARGLSARTTNSDGATMKGSPVTLSRTSKGCCSRRVSKDTIGRMSDSLKTWRACTRRTRGAEVSTRELATNQLKVQQLRQEYLDLRLQREVRCAKAVEVCVGVLQPHSRREIRHRPEDLLRFPRRLRFCCVKRCNESNDKETNIATAFSSLAVSNVTRFRTY
jgi:hypothetical protein